MGFNNGQWLVVEGGAWRCELEIWVFFVGFFAAIYGFLMQFVQSVGFFIFLFFCCNLG